MKKKMFFLLGFALLSLLMLASCSQSGPSQASVNCSARGEICIHIDKIQPFTMGEPMVLNIIVSSTKDYSDLYVTLDTTSGMTIDGPQTWENYLTKTSNDRGIAYWGFAIQAGQTLTFKRILRFPSEEGGYFIQADVYNLGRSVVGTDILRVLLEQKGVQLIRAGTPYPPVTPHATSAFSGLGPGTPLPTWVPDRSGTALAITYTAVVSTKFAPLVSTSTPVLSAYPPPPASSPTPTPTPRSSPYP